MEVLNMKRRILFFHYEFPGGGGERVTRDIAKYLQPFGYETYIVTSNRKDGQTPEVTLIELPDRRLDSKENADVIIRTILSLSIDVFVVPGFLLDHLEYIRKQTSCRFVYILHNVPFWEAIAKLERRKRIQGSFVKKMEWYLLGYPKAVWLKRYMKKCIEDYKSTYNLVDAYVVLCDAYKKQLIEILGLPVENKLYVIHNSEKKVDNVNLDKRKQILFVGNMIYENKRVDRLLDIWGMVYKKIPDWELVLVGGGKEEKSLRQQAAQMNLERVIFIGGTQDVQSYYRDASVSCLTSTFEGWPLCLTEAQANGVVPIAFNCCAGISEILSPSGINGILVPPFDKEKFANELYGLLSSPDKMKQMRTEVLLKSQDYSMDIVGPKWSGLFDLLLESNNSK